MIKTTIKELKYKAKFTTLEAVKNFLSDNSLKITEIEKVAVATGIYGCNGYLIRLTTDNGYYFYAFTNRSTWMYDCTNLSIYND